MLFYPIPKSLGCAAYVARITLARKFINDGTFLVGRYAILLNGRKGPPRAVNIQFQIYWALLRTKLLKSRKTCDLFLSIRQNDVFWIAVVQKDRFKFFKFSSFLFKVLGSSLTSGINSLKISFC